MFDLVLSSPPYADQQTGGGIYHTGTPSQRKTGNMRSPVGYRDQGHTPGQLGSMKDGTIPEDTMTPPHDADTWQNCYSDSWQGIITEAAFAHPAKYSRSLIRRIYDHLKDCGRIVPGMVCLDPFGGVALGALDAMFHGLTYIGVELEEKFWRLGQENIELWNSRHAKGWPGWGRAVLLNGDSRNLAAVVEGAGVVVSSPPYEGYFTQAGGGNAKLEHSGNGGPIHPRWYGEAQGNIGQVTGETFWAAARQIVAQCHTLLKPGGVAVWVTKRFVRQKKIVDFSQQWASLCESVGFRLLHWHRAMLMSDSGDQLNLFDEPEKLIKKKASFFRRLAEKKGSPEINWEDVVCFSKE